MFGQVFMRFNVGRFDAYGAGAINGISAIDRQVKQLLFQLCR